ncbi:kinase-like domain-containing protein [Rhizophagus irregularis DAOM 181602=DAOM 197198]|uniref:Mkk2p n=1 Tax=Rhizophagus irregularis (strain DAOM 197198w) TaxID=1432141 RepID=A0A015IIF8_RHIIW|nr:Mkk2p [Rhizophagus irregularis DAOM 197198w]GET62511.1 kinase-like domain-containing protein [Rhizophagus irregularis DAOM 181602=DAOM 197198]
MFSQKIPLTRNNILKYLRNNFTNWTSGNERIDNFIQERQLKINDYEYDNIMLEWIPYNQFNEIKETGKNDLITVYSATWKDGPLYKKERWNNYTRISNKKVALKCLYNSQESIDLINEAKKYTIQHNAFQVLYGISQNPDTGNYILVQNSSINLANWISGNEKIDNYIQERQLKANDYEDTVLEWIPYDQFNEIKETGRNGFITLYSAIWKDGPLCKKHWRDENYTRNSNKKVGLKYYSQESIDSLMNKVKKYLTKHKAFQVLYGLSQNPDTGNYFLVQNSSINLANWISGSEKIDDFIQERQIFNYYDDTVLEWIPYNQFNGIKEISENGLTTVYSAIWKDGPLYYDHEKYEYKRNSYKEVALKCLYNSQGSIDSLINEAKKYPTKHKSFQVLYGISQNPDTRNYILVLIWTSGNEKIDDFIQERQLNINDCEEIVLEWIPYNQFNEIKRTDKNGLVKVYSAIWKDGPLCKKENWRNYTRKSNKEVTLKCLNNSQEFIDCLINEAKKYPIKHNSFQALYGISQNPNTGDFILVLIWTSGNEKIDDFIQEKQLKINNYDDDIAPEWISYNQFNEIIETEKNDVITVYSAIWKDGPLYWNVQNKNYVRESNKKVTLKCLCNSQESIDSLINKAKKYPTNRKSFQVLYGISQDPDTGDYILVLIWTSGNEKIDDFIQERQLSINVYNDIVLEWIPYNQFSEIKASGKNGFITVYSAIWKNGPLYKTDNWRNYYIRNSNKRVALKCLDNSQEFIDYLINEAKKYPTKYNTFQVLYGLSQDPNTRNYILVLIWASGNEKIDEFIREKQLNINYYDDIMPEWISYNQFNEIKEIGKNDFITVYSAVWKDGPLCKMTKWSNYTRDSNKEVVLKLYNIQGSIDFLINEAKKYSTKYKSFQVLYGMSQNPNTGNYILVQKNSTWISKNKIINDFIQERQLKINDNNYEDIVFEWIPYNQFDEIKKMNMQSKNYIRDSNKKVTLKCLYNSNESINSLINEAKKYPTNHKSFQVLYGISQNQHTGDYILVQKNSIWISGNEKIDDFIQERQLKINDDNYDDIMLEWIPYNQFNEIKETGKNDLITVYSAIWKDGPLYYDHQEYKYKRNSNKKVALKCLHNSQGSIDSLINEAKKYPTKYKSFQVLYGISQNPDTGYYILVLIWTSGNEKIDDFIQEMQSKINDDDDDIIVFEWIPYNQFNNIKEIGKGGFATVYSANWKNGILKYDVDRKIYNRDPNRVIALKSLHNSQNITNKFLNEVKEYSINKKSNVLNIYGISQNLNTKEYVMVLQYAKDGNFNQWIKENYEYFIWENKLSALLNIINGIKEIHQKSLVHRDFHTGNILFLSNIDNFGNCISISDMGLCGEVGNIDETKIYGVMPYVAPEVLRGKPYTQAADIYSYGMIMYFVATGKQPFGDCAHDHNLALDICKGVRPEISEPEAPRCYIDLMKKCWDIDKNNRPDIFEIDKLINSFHKSYGGDIFIVEDEEIEMQFKIAEEYRKENPSSIENYKTVTHPQAIYTSRLLNPFTKDLPKYDDDYNSQYLDDCALPINFN